MTGKRARWRAAWPTAAIAAAGLLLYAHSLRYRFTYFDDAYLILEHQYFLRSPANLLQAFRQEVLFLPAGEGAYYRPLFIVSAMLDARLGGASPLPYRLTNLLLHLLASCLVFRLLTKLRHSEKAAFFFSLFFALHPLAVQAVCWIPGRDDSLLAVFCLLAFLSALDHWETGATRDALFSIASFALAMFSRETAAMLIPLLLFYRLRVAERPARGGVLLLGAGWMATVGLWLWLRHCALPQPTALTASRAVESLLDNSPLVAPYFGNVLLPFHLAALAATRDMPVAFGLAAAAGVALALFFSKTRDWRKAAFGAAWFLLFLLPSLAAPNFRADRVYPSLFGAILVLLEVDWLKDFQPRWKAALAAAVLVALSAAAFAHSLDFRDRLSFWSSAVAASPRLAQAHSGLADALKSAGRLDEAEREYGSALALDDSQPRTHNNLGAIYFEEGRLALAEQEYKKELSAHPRSDVALLNLGALYYDQGRLKEAEDCWVKGTESNPSYVDAWSYLALLYYRQGRLDEAAGSLRRLKDLGAIAEFPDLRARPKAAVDAFFLRLVRQSPSEPGGPDPGPGG